MKKVAGQLRLQLAQFRALAAFAQFASDLDKFTRSQLDLGQRLTEILKQPQYEPMPVEDQVMSIFAATNHAVDDVAVEKVKAWQSAFLQFMHQRYPDVGRSIATEKALSDDTAQKLKSAIADFNAQWQG